MIERWSEGIAEDGMAKILVDLADLVRRHPWWQARAAFTLDFLDGWRFIPRQRSSTLAVAGESR